MSMITLRLRWCLSILCILSLTACGPSVPQTPAVVYVIVTSDAQQTAAAPIGGSDATLLPPSNALLPTATPALPPDQALLQAERQTINGFYEQAAANYQTVLNAGDTIPSDQRANAAFRLGQAALRDGAFDQAAEAFTLLITQFPQAANIAQAYYLRGDAYMGLSQWQASIDDYQTYLSLRAGLVDSYVYESIADAQLGLGQADAAMTSYINAATAERGLVPQLQLREKIARVFISYGRVADGVAQYDAILAVARNEAYRATIAFAAAQTLIDNGDLAGGVARLQTIFDSYPATPEAYQAMQVLVANAVPIDDYARGRVAFLNGEYDLAVDAFNRYGTQTQLGSIPAEMYLMLGRAYRELGNSAAAQTAFNTIVQQYPQDPAFGDALLETGRTLFLSGDVQGAIARYLEIADTYGYLTETAAQALWRAGYLYGTRDQTTESIAVFTRLADTYPATEDAQSGLLLAASAAVKIGQDGTAEMLFGRIASNTTGEDQAVAYFWVARLATKRGDTAQANQAYALATQAAPDSYYAARANDIANGIQPFQQPTQVRFTFDEAADMAETQAWLRSTFNITQEGDLATLPPALVADPRIIRGSELWMLGYYAEAEIEFNEVIDENKADALISFQLAIFLRDIHCYQPSIVAAANVIRASGVSTLAAPHLLARMRYPAYYSDIIQDVSARRNLDPLLMLALIRHESLFDTNATAAAGEKGLTQVIPPTGQYIADQIQWPGYQHADLFRPYAGIEFGAYYLSEQMRLFDNLPYIALSAYNAGPGRAQDWRALSGDDPDLYMNAITIDSTQLYVQRIYSHYSIYRVLYGT
jgi:soluble lytic murein transglycosylase